MNTSRSILLTILALPIMLNWSCATTSPTPNPKINHDKAVIIAATNVPYSVINNTSIISLLKENIWIISFTLSGSTVSKDELNWPSGDSTSFKNQGLLPNGVFRLLTFTLDASTGDIISREASDSIILGGPGVFYKEQQPIYQKVWFSIVTAIIGILAGGLIMWLFMRLKRI